MLIYIAKRLREALRLEKIFTDAGVDYGVEADQYHGGVVLRGLRTGAFFYVLPQSVEAARRVMLDHRYRPRNPED